VTLSEDERQGLTGPAIGDKIREKRLAAVSEVKERPAGSAAAVAIVTRVDCRPESLQRPMGSSSLVLVRRPAEGAREETRVASSTRNQVALRRKP